MHQHAQSSAVLLNHSTCPCEDNSWHRLYWGFHFLPLILFCPPHIRVSCRWSLFGTSFCLFIYGRASLAMEGKSVMPMEITYMDTEDEYKKYGTLSPLRYIYSNPFMFPISSLGLPYFPSQKSWEGALAKIYRQGSSVDQTEPWHITLIPHFQSNPFFLHLAF